MIFFNLIRIKTIHQLFPPLTKVTLTAIVQSILVYPTLIMLVKSTQKSILERTQIEIVTLPCLFIIAYLGSLLCDYVYCVMCMGTVDCFELVFDHDWLVNETYNFILRELILASLTSSRSFSDLVVRCKRFLKIYLHRYFNVRM